MDTRNEYNILVDRRRVEEQQTHGPFGNYGLFQQPGSRPILSQIKWATAYPSTIFCETSGKTAGGVERKRTHTQDVTNSKYRGNQKNMKTVYNTGEGGESHDNIQEEAT